MKTKATLLLLPIMLVFGITALAAQEEPTTIAIFPFKNLYGEVQYDDLGWSYADSLEVFLNAQPGSGANFALVPNVDVKDQMLAMNVDVKAPSYETDVWTIAEALGASKIVWGTYFTKYGKVYLKVEIIDLSVNMADTENVGESKGLLYEEAITSVPTVGEKIVPGL
jgi:hypothetical protein